MGNRNELNNEQLMRINMVDLVKSNFENTTYATLYGGNVVISEKIVLFDGFYDNMQEAITQKIHDSSGAAPDKEAKKHTLANYTSRKGKAASVYYKGAGFTVIEAMLHKEPWEIFEMTDTACISYCGDVRSRLNTDVLLLPTFGTNAGVIIILDGYISAFSGVKTAPGEDRTSKDTGGDEVDVQIANILDIFHDLDSMIPDAFIDTHSGMVEDYEAKRVEITVGTRHTILNVSMRIKPSLNPAARATFTIKNAENVIVKVLTMDNIHGASSTILRMAEYTGITHLDGYIDKTQVFRPNYRSHLDLGFDLDPIV